MNSERKNQMNKFKLLCLAILSIMAIFMLAACGGDAGAQAPPAIPDFDVQIQAQNEEPPADLATLLSVHFIDVGQGDAILLVQGDYAMLVDGGPTEAGLDVFAYIRDLGISRLTYVVNTHPFADHVGGLPAIISRMDVDYVLIPMVHHSTPDFYAFLGTLESVGQVIVPLADAVQGNILTDTDQGNIFRLGDAEITILSPMAADNWDNVANYSIVMRVVFGNTSFLLTGDAMREVESRLLDSDAVLSSDVLKVSRHGSAAATTSAFLDAVNPSIAIISAEAGSDFISQEVLGRLSSRGIHTFKTYERGTIVITSDGAVLSVVVEK